MDFQEYNTFEESDESEKAKRIKRNILMIVPCLILASLLAGVGAYSYFSYTLPPIRSLEDYKPPIITQVFSNNGELIGEFCQERRIVIPIHKIPKVLNQAFVAAEDANFFKHKGISYRGILRAIIRDIMAGRLVQGGSTITQQTVRSMLLSRERKLSRKIRELLLAHRIEKYLTKDEILYIYLNQIYLGHGNYGVEAAARDYFDKGVEELTLSEAALLAGLPQAPEKYSPISNFQQAKARQAYALGRMVEDDCITRKEADEALKAPLEIKSRGNRFLNVAPYFTEYVRIYLQEKYGEEALYIQGLQVHTTVDFTMQEAAQRTLQEELRTLDRRQGYRGPEKVLQKDEIEAFCKEESQKFKENPIKAGETYQGVVRGIDDKRQVWVQIGDRKGYIPFDQMRWARTPNPDVDHLAALLKDPSQALKTGYVIKVKVKEIPPKGLVKLDLEQEPEVQGALLALELPTGCVRAMVGGRDFLGSQFNRAVQARRQPGSAFKPILYAAALDKGFTPASIIIDSPIIYYDVLKDDTWKPKNFEERFYGPTTLRTALTQSRNVVTIKLTRDIGIPYAIKYAQKLGIGSPLSPNLSLALGSSEVTLLELVRAYAVFAARGHLIQPLLFIKKVQNRDGETLEENHPLPLEADLMKEQGEIIEEDLKQGTGGVYPRVVDEKTAYIMTSLLKGVVQQGTGRRAQALGRPCAGKTGTTNEYTDAWFVGFTPDLVAGVWVGFDEKKPLGRFETGSRAALPIWVSFMQKAVEGRPVKDFPIPDGVVFAKIDPETGLLALPGTQNAIFECFKEGTQPTTYTSETSSGETDDFLKSDTMLQEE